jgi:adenylate cyclase
MASDHVKRKLAAIVAADVVGYSRLMGADEAGTLARLKQYRRELIDPKNRQYRGRVVKTTGDGILIEFPSVVDALCCSIEVQQGMHERNADVAPEKRIEFRVGINLGDVIIEGRDLYGDGMNIAARLEGLAEPGGICISQTVLNHARGKIAFEVEDLGEQALKNIVQRVHVYRLLLNSSRGDTASLRSEPALALPDKPSIAVLPFQNMSGDPEQEYFADGIVEDMITALSRFKALFVIARNSSFTYKGRAVDVKQVGRELGVRYVLEGSVRKAANRLRITGQLVDATTGAHLWADRFDGAAGDIFELQDQVTENVVGAIAPAVEKAEIERAKRKPTDSIDAHGLYMRGLARFYRFARQENEEALRLFKSAIKLDPDFASAFGRAACCYAFAQGFGWISVTPNEVAEVKTLTRHAVEFGKDDAVALASSAFGLAHVVRDLSTAAALIDRALTLNSNLADAWYYGGWIKNWLGEPELSIARFERAMRLSPLDPSLSTMRCGIAHANFFLGQYDKAASWAAMSLQDDPDFLPSLRIEAASHAMTGREESARRAVARLQELQPELRVSILHKVLGPYRHVENIARYQEGLRRAGLPE